MDLVKADATSRLFFNTGLWGFAIAPFMKGREGYPLSKGSQDGAIDLKELLGFITNDPGMAGAGADRFVPTGFISGNNQEKMGGLPGLLWYNMKRNAIPSAVTIIGADLVKKGLKKFKVLQPLDKLNKIIGINKEVRWS